MKNDIVLFITGCTMMLMASCLGSDDIDTTEIKNAQIASLVLSHDSITELSGVKFTIDQLNGYIFNKDSLPYGTEVGKVICTLTYEIGVTAIGVTIQQAAGDTTYWWNGSDSIDFTHPVRFTTTAYDNSTTKNYRVWVNIHQVVPDSMVWERHTARMTGADAVEQKAIKHTYDGSDVYLLYIKTATDCQVFYSPVTDAKTWTKLLLSGLPNNTDLSQITSFEQTLYAPAGGSLYQSADGLTWSRVDIDVVLTVKALLGVVNKGRNPSPLLAAAVADREGANVFASMNSAKKWTTGDATPANFPLSGFGSLSYERMSNTYLAVVAGKDKTNAPLNTTWATSDALSWATLSGEKENYFEKKAGVMLTFYDDRFYLVGGVNAEGQAVKDIHVSLDNGTTWTPADSLKAFPEEYTPRGYASVEVDANQYMLIFGGKTSDEAKPLDELWRGCINRLR
jgi:hypothetical protein